MNALEMLWAPRRSEYMPKNKKEALGYLVEEMGEALSAAGKLLRWGPESINPEASDEETNREWLERELQDVEVAIALVRKHGL